MVSGFLALKLRNESFNVGPFVSDDGEVFQVKKSSQSRRLMKAKKAERKRDRRDNNSDGENDDDSAITPRMELEKGPVNVIEEEMDIKFKDTLPVKTNKKPEEVREWTLSGREAEALHFEEEDEEEDEKERPPFRDSVLQSGFIPFCCCTERKGLEKVLTAPHSELITLSVFYAKNRGLNVNAKYSLIF